MHYTFTKIEVKRAVFGVRRFNAALRAQVLKNNRSAFEQKAGSGDNFFAEPAPVRKTSRFLAALLALNSSLNRRTPKSYLLEEEGELCFESLRRF